MRQAAGLNRKFRFNLKGPVAGSLSRVIREVHLEVLCAP